MGQNDLLEAATYCSHVNTAASFSLALSSNSSWPLVVVLFLLPDVCRCAVLCSQPAASSSTITSVTTSRQEEATLLAFSSATTSSTKGSCVVPGFGGLPAQTKKLPLHRFTVHCVCTACALKIVLASWLLCRLESR